MQLMHSPYSKECQVGQQENWYQQEQHSTVWEINFVVYNVHKMAQIQ